MERNKVYAALISLILFCTGCGKIAVPEKSYGQNDSDYVNEQAEESFHEEMNDVATTASEVPEQQVDDNAEVGSTESPRKADEYVSEDQVQVFGEESHLVSPTGICLFGDEVLVSDHGINALLRYDRDCNYLGQIGEQGSGQLQFENPTAVKAYGDRLYVLDAGNNRIQILNESYEYIKEIALPKPQYVELDSYYQDIAVQSENLIYVSVSCVISKDANIVIVCDDRITRIWDIFTGCLCDYDGQILAADTYRCVQVNASTQRFEMGQNYLYRLEDSARTQLCALPGYYAPMAMNQMNEYIVAVSGSDGSVDLFDIEGNRVRSIYSVGYPGKGPIGVTASEETIYIVISTQNSLYKITL